MRKPRDKAKVETGVLVVERWILARLRNHTFFSLGELNATIRELLERLNTRPFKKLAGSRRSRFEELERAALRPLPIRAYEFGEWKKAKVHPDYHIEVGRAYYSVPYALIGECVDVRLTRPWRRGVPSRPDRRRACARQRTRSAQYAPWPST